jgi:hypothetical protein
LHIYGHVGGYANEPETSLKQFQRFISVSLQNICFFLDHTNKQMTDTFVTVQPTMMLHIFELHYHDSGCLTGNKLARSSEQTAKIKI